MIYALSNRDISDHERRVIARHVRDKRYGILQNDDRIVHVCDSSFRTAYLCVYCLETVVKWMQGDRAHFSHLPGAPACLGTDKGLPGIPNPVGVTTICD